MLTAILSGLAFFIVFHVNVLTDRRFLTDPVEFFLNYSENVIPGSSAMTYVISFVTAILGTGYLRYVMKISRGQSGGTRDVFSAFNLTLKIIGMQIVTTVFMVLWMIPGYIVWTIVYIVVIGAVFVTFITDISAQFSNPGDIDFDEITEIVEDYLNDHPEMVSTLITVTVIFVLLMFVAMIPSYIAMYRYRLAIFILLDNHDYRIMECINESKRLMRGNKGKLFVLDLSFIGWGLLFSLTFNIVGIWKLAYLQLTHVRFYEFLSGSRGAVPLTTELPPVE
jgi:uncharacterized membrane protein